MPGLPPFPTLRRARHNSGMTQDPTNAPGHPPSRAAGSRDTSYMFNNATEEAARQVWILADMLDTHSRNVLSTIGVRPGNACLDLGAGAGTVAAWLADKVGPSGTVTAIDRDPRHIPPTDLFEVQAGDVATLDLGTGQYDLIHMRLLLMHLPQRDLVLRKAVAALKPGGTLVVSDWDCTRLDAMMARARPGVAAAFNTFQKALAAAAVATGVSLDWARRVPIAMDEAGLTDIGATMHNELSAGGQAGCLLQASNSRQLESALLDNGVTTADLALLRDGMADPYTLMWSYPMVTATGRKRSD
jgi:2-polyprenyl-3-methyl-5-hydroxy-6-metoxy-1,4-benzoquinol methylase